VTRRVVAVLAIAAILLVALATQVTATRPVTASTSSGGFDLRFEASRSRYGAGERIDPIATLTYHGPLDRIRITTALGGPLYFGVESDTGHLITPGWRDKAVAIVMQRDVPIVRPFMKSGGSGPDDPDWAFFRDYFASGPALRLPAGHWRIWVMTHITPDGSSPSDPIEIEVSLQLDVG
jgi:hypothetical protein